MTDNAQSLATATPRWAQRWVDIMDDGLRIPGTSVRFGLDAVLGLLLPEVGDIVGALCSLGLVWVAIRNRVPMRVLAQMVLNIAVDALAGAVPLIGDLFDVAFKANRRNLALLESTTPDAPTPRGAGAYGMLALAAVAVLSALAVPLILSLLAARWLFF